MTITNDDYEDDDEDYGKKRVLYYKEMKYLNITQSTWIILEILI